MTPFYPLHYLFFSCRSSKKKTQQPRIISVFSGLELQHPGRNDSEVYIHGHAQSGHCRFLLGQEKKKKQSKGGDRPRPLLGSNQQRERKARRGIPSKTGATRHSQLSGVKGIPAYANQQHLLSSNHLGRR